MTIPSVALNAYAQAASMGGGAGAAKAGVLKESGGGSFGDFLQKAISETVETGKASEHQMAATAGAKDSNIVDVVTAVSEAETTLQTVVAVRDKVIMAYQEIMRMPV